MSNVHSYIYFIGHQCNFQLLSFFSVIQKNVVHYEFKLVCITLCRDLYYTIFIIFSVLFIDRETYMAAVYKDILLTETTICQS